MTDETSKEKVIIKHVADTMKIQLEGFDFPLILSEGQKVELKIINGAFKGVKND